MAGTKILFDTIAKRLTDRFGIPKKEAKVIVKETFAGLREVLVNNDEIRIPHIGIFRLVTSFRKSYIRYSMLERSWIDGPLTFFRLHFKPAAELKIAFKKRKTAGLPPREYVLINKENRKKKNEAKV